MIERLSRCTQLDSTAERIRLNGIDFQEKGFV